METEFSSTEKDKIYKGIRKKYKQVAKNKPDGLFKYPTGKAGLEALQYDAEIIMALPGGFYSYGFDEAFDEKIHKLASDIYYSGGYIATMCVGILPIADAGLLKGIRATTYPYSRNHDNIARLKKNGAIVVNGPIVMDDRIISCSGPGSAIDVAFLLMDHLLDAKTTREVRKYMIYKNV